MSRGASSRLRSESGSIDGGRRTSATASRGLEPRIENTAALVLINERVE